MMSDKQIRADKLTVARTPDGGATLYLSTERSATKLDERGYFQAYEVSLSAEAWGKLEEYVRWQEKEALEQVERYGETGQPAVAPEGK